MGKEYFVFVNQSYASMPKIKKLVDGLVVYELPREDAYLLVVGHKYVEELYTALGIEKEENDDLFCQYGLIAKLDCRTGEKMESELLGSAVHN